MINGKPYTYFIDFTSTSTFTLYLTIKLSSGFYKKYALKGY